MRILRVTTNKPDGRFEGLLSADLVVQPNARLALANAAFEIAESEIVIGPKNNELEYTQGSETYKARIDSRTYSTNQGNDLLTNIEKALNSTAEFYPGVGNEQMIGMEYRVALNNSGKVSFEARKGEVGELVSPSTAKTYWEAAAGINVPDVASPGQIVWGVNTGVPDGQCRPAQIAYSIPTGNAYMECTIHTADDGGPQLPANPERSGVWLCYTPEDLSSLPVESLRTALQTEAGRIKYCWRGVGCGIVPAGGGTVDYYGIVKGVALQFGVTSANPVVAGAIDNPRIRLSRSKANTFVVSAWDKDATVVNDELLPPGPDEVEFAELFQFVVLWGQDTHISISQVQACVSPFAKDALVSESEEDAPDVGLGATPIKPVYYEPQGATLADNLYQPNYAVTGNALDFEGSDLAAFLGFRFARSPLSGFRNGINFVANANYRFGPRLTSQSVVCLSESIPLVSYDTTQVGALGQGQLRSILAVIPVSASNDGKIAWEAGNLFWVDVHNKKPLQLRSLKFRLVDGSYNSISTFGLASLVILIEDSS
jgi:hypothetical protein